MKNNWAGFWLRLLAHAIDVSLGLLTLTIPAWMILVNSTKVETIIPPTGALLYYLVFLLPLLTLVYRTVLTSKVGGGLGKLLCGIKVVDKNGELIRFRKALFRYVVGYFVSSLLFGLGFFWITRDPQKRGWHDQISGSYVILEKPKRWIVAAMTLAVLLFANSFLISNTIQSIKENKVLQSQIQAIIEETAQSLLENSQAPATIDPQQKDLII